MPLVENQLPRRVLLWSPVKAGEDESANIEAQRISFTLPRRRSVMNTWTNDGRKSDVNSKEEGGGVWVREKLA